MSAEMLEMGEEPKPPLGLTGAKRDGAPVTSPAIHEWVWDTEALERLKRNGYLSPADGCLAWALPLLGILFGRLGGD